MVVAADVVMLVVLWLVCVCVGVRGGGNDRCRYEFPSASANVRGVAARQVAGADYAAAHPLRHDCGRALCYGRRKLVRAAASLLLLRSRRAATAVDGAAGGATLGRAGCRDQTSSP